MPLKEGDRVEIIGIEKMESWVQKHFGNRDLRLYATGVDPGDPSDLGYFLGCGGKEIRPKGVQVKWREDQLFPLGGESKPKEEEEENERGESYGNSNKEKGRRETEMIKDPNKDLRKKVWKGALSLSTLLKEGPLGIEKSLVENFTRVEEKILEETILFWSKNDVIMKENSNIFSPSHITQDSLRKLGYLYTNTADSCYYFPTSLVYKAVEEQRLSNRDRRVLNELYEEALVELAESLIETPILNISSQVEEEEEISLVPTRKLSEKVLKMIALKKASKEE